MFKLCHLCKSRTDIPYMLNAFGLIGQGVEVGVWRGDYSYRIMERWKGKCLYLVDPWAKLPDEEYKDIRNDHFDPKDYDYVVERMAEFCDRVKIVRTTSEQAAETQLVPNGLDFVYVDGNHAYFYVHADLHMWWFKLKKGGILAGHDIFNIDCPDVTHAITEFATDMGVEIILVPGDMNEHQCLVNAHSWYIIKE